eukprot:GHRR01002796.1.p1 GENE.GHRR01002796.1~~GHRR01002796.1.p1  ORF type:complete len:148 (+),score=30.18 GHRR01002796.1:162-605(+)
MEMHHKLRRDPSWDPRGCNLCGQVGHQAVECPNGTVNWKAIYGDDCFILRPPVYESQLRERRKLKQINIMDVTKHAEEYAKAAAARQGLSWDELQRAAAASQTAQIQPAAKPDEGLPEGWAVAYDPNGKPYYWHKATQKTQWEKPTA